MKPQVYSTSFIPSMYQLQTNFTNVLPKFQPASSRSWIRSGVLLYSTRTYGLYLILFSLNLESSYDSAYSHKFSRHISVLPDLYAQLKVLSIEFQGFNFQFDERIVLALQSTWMKLQLLRLCVLNKKRESPRVNLSSIAPGFHWYRELDDGGSQPEPFSKRIKLEAGKNTFFVCRRRQTSAQGIRNVDFTTKQQKTAEETWFPFGSQRSKTALNPAEVTHGNA